ncbi:hypothetical protein CYMTET_35013 [Cymbomonas tetramitiformis]|uniref:Pentatricopeptide repeat-containing protein n=1 Tax=Cymbomonas tetramitiformis TaxID=36881 RepID=A0AAE0KPB1_9CHLO|nr:hypothetical protein CYMTET_35013 [Cymbomonas tetramitiformis]
MGRQPDYGRFSRRGCGVAVSADTQNPEYALRAAKPLISKSFVPEALLQTLSLAVAVATSSVTSHLHSAGVMVCAHNRFTNLDLRPSHAFNSLAAACLRVGHDDRGQRALQQMQAHGLQLDVYAYTMQVDLWCRQGDIESASATLEEMKLQGVHPNVVTYTALVKVCDLRHTIG